MSFRRRPYPEVLDNLLTHLTGGVAAELHPFPPSEVTAPPYQHHLQQPKVGAIQSIYGSRDGEPTLFNPGKDYTLLPDQQTVQWLEGGQLPDPGTLVAINYYPESAQPILTDIYTGSVARTLSETVALEIARLYAQLEVVYDSGFVDTATDSALDKVVALLGIERVTGGRAAGLVEFTRSANSLGAINIPAGTRVLTADGNVEYETTATVQMAPGQNTIRVNARDLETNDPLPADSLTVLALPLVGIERVTNPAPTAIATQSESDAELRSRAKNFLYSSQRATLGALQQAIARQGVKVELDEVLDETTGCPYVRVIVQEEAMPPELHQRILQAIEDARPAGVRVEPPSIHPPVKIHLQLRLTTNDSLLDQDRQAIQRSLRDAYRDYFAKLPVGQAGSLNRLIGLALALRGVEDVQILKGVRGDTQANILERETGQLLTVGFPTTLGDLDITDVNLPTRLTVIVTAPADAAPVDRPAMQAAMTTALTTLNRLNAVDDPPLASRQVSYSRLLQVVPLPNKPAAPLADHNPATPIPAIAPYQVQFVITQASQLSYRLAQASDPIYELTPFERLSLLSIEVQGGR
ncbi:MAG TPA: baseplate J/gp47 family protein [Synechococcales cyanobacterium M55_K2018_004]|nr:baseplate J/gp47 family protein [Synechococcales cyanobacterium M55_K2018_004]